MRPELPNEGEWPCQQEPAVDPPPRLIDFLYLLVRDMTPGDIEQLALQVRNATEQTSHTNRHLRDYAYSLASYLLHRQESESPRTAVVVRGNVKSVWDIDRDLLGASDYVFSLKCWKARYHTPEDAEAQVTAILEECQVTTVTVGE